MRVRCTTNGGHGKGVQTGLVRGAYKQRVRDIWTWHQRELQARRAAPQCSRAPAAAAQAAQAADPRCPRHAAAAASRPACRSESALPCPALPSCASSTSDAPRLPTHQVALWREERVEVGGHHLHADNRLHRQRQEGGEGGEQRAGEHSTHAAPPPALCCAGLLCLRLQVPPYLPPCSPPFTPTCSPCSMNSSGYSSASWPAAALLSPPTTSMALLLPRATRVYIRRRWYLRAGRRQKRGEGERRACATGCSVQPLCCCCHGGCNASPDGAAGRPGRPRRP